MTDSRGIRVGGALTLICCFATALCSAEAETANTASTSLNVQECGTSGSKFETTAATTTGSKEITVSNVGDYKVGQGVMVSKCNVRYQNKILWGPKSAYVASKPLGDAVEIHGYDGSSGSWTVFVLDIKPATSPAFRWSDDLGRTWKPEVPITGDWQPLSGGTEVRFGKLDWESGYVITFSARDQLVSTIEKIEGNALTLKDAANRSVKDAAVRHCDAAALQAAIDRAIKEKRNVYVPVGYYRLARSVSVRKAEGIAIEGASGVNTVLDISDGEGACLNLSGGTEVTLRNLRFLGHTGFDDRDQCGYLNTQGARDVWGFYLKPCHAVEIAGTERVLVENCHASKMSGECFVSGGPSRGTTKQPNRFHTKFTTYLRCSVTDCGRNAFNDWNLGPENTSVLYCRIQDVGGCSWEGASRFVKLIGNYVRNAGTVAIGNLGPANRDPSFEELGAGQHIVADNVFESKVPYGGCAIRSARGATQVLIRNNLFVNFGSSAVEAAGWRDSSNFPSANTTITGNLMDMTEVGEKPVARTAIEVSASDTIISDNQIYVRGACDPKVTAIRIAEPALNVEVHDNLIRNCGSGLVTGRAQSRVGEVVDPVTFVLGWGTMPPERREPNLYRGWNLVWLAGGKPAGLSVVDSFDPKTLRFKLKQQRQVKVGETFEVIPPSANWKIHNNTVADCLNPVVLDSYGSDTSVFRDNLLTRGGVSGVKQALEVRGRFQLIGNHITGFDEPGCSALALFPDRLGNPVRNLYRSNVLERCANAITESQKGLWEASTTVGNLFLECGAAPGQ